MGTSLAITKALRYDKASSYLSIATGARFSGE
jgi:hypothetical protein